MSNPHQADRPEQGRVLRAYQADRGPHAAGPGRRRLRQPDREPFDPAPAGGQPAHHAGHVAREHRDAEEQHDHHGAEDRRHDRDRERATSGDHAEIQADAVDHQRDHVDRVQDHRERDQPAGDDPHAHPGAAQRPCRQRDPARAGRGEQAGRRQPGHRDLVALAPVDPRFAADEHAAEQPHVAAEREHLEQRGQREPPAVPVLDSVPGLLQAEQLRQHEVQERQRRDDEQGGGQQPASGEAQARHLGVVVIAGVRPRSGRFHRPRRSRPGSRRARPVGDPPAATTSPRVVRVPAAPPTGAGTPARAVAPRSGPPPRAPPRRSGRPRSALRGTRAPGRA